MTSELASEQVPHASAHAHAAPAHDDEGARTSRWRRADGLRRLGPVQGSGLQGKSFLLQRGDGQMVHLSELLDLVVAQVDPARGVDEIADAVSTAYGRRLGADGLEHLIVNKLLPLGLINDTTAGGGPARQPRSNPLLALRLRGVLISASGVRRIAAVAAPLFMPPVVVLAVAGLIALDTALILTGDSSASLRAVLVTPGLILALIGLLVVGGLIHEIGHAAACHYGGARPGKIGVGIYLIFPAFFTNVTDSYRLGRAGRIRTDLGGLYFNVWCLLALGGGYLATGQELLLLAALIMHIEMVQQLIPTVRFDGYFILSDLAGVPDLFARVQPVLLSLRPGRGRDPRVAELRPAARRTVTAWVLLVVPLLVIGIGWLLISIPLIVRTTVLAVGAQVQILVSAWGAGSLVLIALTVISIVLVSVPLVGLAVFAPRLLLLLLRRAVSAVASRRRRRHLRETAMSTEQSHDPAATPVTHLPRLTDRPHPAPPPEYGPDQPAAPAAGLRAAAFSDESLRIQHLPAPTRGWRRVAYRLSRGHVRLEPGPAERRALAGRARVRTPISGSRRVVVMSRKGGVGKTTMTYALGITFAAIRSDHVIAVDANPDAGNLAYRADEPSSLSVTDVLSAVGEIHSYSQLRAFTSQASHSRLEILASNDDPRIGLALDKAAYHELSDLLDRFYNLILLDTGTGILDSANQGLTAEADQLVLVLRPALDGARAAALTLDWLDEHGYGDLVANAVVIINGVRAGVGVPLDPIIDHFVTRCAQVVTVPWDKALETGGQTRLASLRPATREALRNAAAAIAVQFQ